MGAKMKKALPVPWLHWTLGRARVDVVETLRIGFCDGGDVLKSTSDTVRSCSPGKVGVSRRSRWFSEPKNRYFLTVLAAVGPWEGSIPVGPVTVMPSMVHTTFLPPRSSTKGLWGSSVGNHSVGASWSNSPMSMTIGGEAAGEDRRLVVSQKRAGDTRYRRLAQRAVCGDGWHLAPNYVRRPKVVEIL